MARGIWYTNVVKLLLSVAIGAFCLTFLIHGFDEKSLRITIRNSARFSAIIFALAFSASAVHRYFKSSFGFWLRMNRRHLGISFAWLFLIHFLLLLLLQYWYHPVFNRAARISLIGGGLAYIFAFLMLLTSFPFFSKKISPTLWKTLHTVGGWWIWYIFIRTYAKRVFDTQGSLAYLPLLIIFMFVALLRVWGFYKKKRTTA